MLSYTKYIVNYMTASVQDGIAREFFCATDGMRISK